MTIRSRAPLAATLAITALIAYDLVLSSGAASAAPQSCTTPDLIQVISADDASSLGYLKATDSYTAVVASADDATSFSYVEGSQRNVVEPTAPQDTPNLGFASGSSGPTLAAGSPGYTLGARTATTEPGGTPQSAANTSFFGSDSNTESAVWSYDAASGALTPSWINPDGQAATVTSFFYYGAYIGLTGDLASFTAEWGPASAVTFQASCDVSNQAQSITYTSTAPQHAHVGDDYAVTATGGDSSSPVVFSSSTPDVCTVDSSTVHFAAAGTCTVAADQAASAGYDAAEQTTQDITVKVGSQVALTTSMGVVSGQSTMASAQVDTDSGPAAGKVQFSVDGTDLGDPVTLDPDGAASSPAYTGLVGDHAVTATFEPYDSTTYDESTDSDTLTIAQADSETTVSTDGSVLRAAVAAVSPGSGVPSGSVAFLVDGHPVGTANLTSQGTASLVHAVATGGTHSVSAQYAGDDEFVGSSGSTNRTDPSIVATIDGTLSKDDWYRSAVQISFTCTTHGSPLVAGCPTPVTVESEGAAQSLTRTISAVDGGIATTTARFNIDRSAPQVKVSGVVARGRYFATDPRFGCASSDQISGIRSCTITRSSGSFGPVTVTAHAIDRAGNLTLARAYYVKVRYAVAGAEWSDGAWEVRKGHTYDLLALSGGHPRVVGPGTDHPSGLGAFFDRSGSVDGTPRWSHAMSMDMSTRYTRSWKLGVYDNSETRALPVRLIG